MAAKIILSQASHSIDEQTAYKNGNAHLKQGGIKILLFLCK
jgi:hypothetical protein